VRSLAALCHESAPCPPFWLLFERCRHRTELLVLNNAQMSPEQEMAVEDCSLISPPVLDGLRNSQEVERGAGGGSEVILAHKIRLDSTPSTQPICRRPAARKDRPAIGASQNGSAYIKQAISRRCRLSSAGGMRTARASCLGLTRLLSAPAAKPSWTSAPPLPISPTARNLPNGGNFDTSAGRFVNSDVARRRCLDRHRMRCCLRT
jgi:hypothetical protein